MRFTYQQLARIAAWEIADDRLVGIDLLGEVRNVMSRVANSGKWECRLVKDDGLSNYYSFAVHRALSKQERSRSRHHMPHTDNGILVYFSSTVPVAVLGHTRISIATDSLGAQPFELKDLIPPSRGLDDAVDEILGAFENSIYEFPDLESLMEPLPPGISPDEYCLCAEPWDRVFHVLFADTD